MSEVKFACPHCDTKAFEAAKAERAAIVAWLRNQSEGHRSLRTPRAFEKATALRIAANQIEQTTHLRTQSI